MTLVQELLFRIWRKDGILDAAKILDSKRLEVAHDANTAWTTLYNASRYLTKKLELKEVA